MSLDEAFDGIDDDNRRSCFRVLRDLDLDVQLSAFDMWARYPEVPGIAIHTLSHPEGVGGVGVVEAIWTGDEMVDG